MRFRFTQAVPSQLRGLPFLKHADWYSDSAKSVMPKCIDSSFLTEEPLFDKGAYVYISKLPTYYVLADMKDLKNVRCNQAFEVLDTTAAAIKIQLEAGKTPTWLPAYAFTALYKQNFKVGDRVRINHIYTLENDWNVLKPNEEYVVEEVSDMVTLEDCPYAVHSFILEPIEEPKQAAKKYDFRVGDTITIDGYSGLWIVRKLIINSIYAISDSNREKVVSASRCKFAPLEAADKLQPGAIIQLTAEAKQEVGTWFRKYVITNVYSNEVRVRPIGQYSYKEVTVKKSKVIFCYFSNETLDINGAKICVGTPVIDQEHELYHVTAIIDDSMVEVRGKSMAQFRTSIIQKDPKLRYWFDDESKKEAPKSAEDLLKHYM